MTQINTSGISDDNEFVSDVQYPSDGQPQPGAPMAPSAITEHMGQFYVQEPHKREPRPWTPRRVLTYANQVVPVFGQNLRRAFIVVTTDQTNTDVVYITNGQTPDVTNSFGLYAGCNWLQLPTTEPLYVWSPSSNQIVYLLEAIGH